MTFRDYLAGRKSGYDAQGDFVRLALADPDMPEVTTWDELSAYIERRGNFHAVQTGQVIWKEYQLALSKAGGV